MKHDELQYRLERFIDDERLPAAYIDLVNSHLVPLAAWIAEKKEPDQLFVMGINGAQGSGKSTMTAVLSLLLGHRYGLSTAILSIDDLYLSREKRQQLAKDIHPLFITRGVPATHDVQLGLDTLNDLKQGIATRLPRFNKGQDNPEPESAWPRCESQVDIVLFEGWCLGLLPQPDHMLLEAINDLEAVEDADGRWRQHVNNQLHGLYQKLFAELDALLFLETPDFDAVRRWRAEQEAKLDLADADLRMNPQQLLRFIRHFERLTDWAKQSLADGADIVFKLGEDHQVTRVHYR